MTCNPVSLILYDAVAIVTLSRPNAANSMNLALLKALSETILQIDEDAGIRAVVLTGSGRFFSAGGDLGSFADQAAEMPLLLKRLTLHLHAAISGLLRMRAPVVAAVNGPAAGAGLALVAACDLVVASEAASFTSAYTAAGLSPDGASTWTLPRRIGPGRARELMLTNRRLSAAEALDWGLVNEVVPPDQVLSRALDLATTLTEGATSALGRTRALLLDSLSTGLETQMELEARMIADSARTSDAQEGVTAFVSKRTPRFLGC